MTRRGKIARLPRVVREELNRRLRDGEPGIQLVAWLNQHPETKRVLAESFDGREINEPNLSAWKAGGFQDWLAQHDALEQARELTADGKELKAATEGGLTEHLATVLAARYGSTLAYWNGEVTDEFRRKLRTMRKMCENIVALRRGDHNNARLALEQERFKREEAREVARPSMLTEEEQLLREMLKGDDTRCSILDAGAAVRIHGVDRSSGALRGGA